MREARLGPETKREVARQLVRVLYRTFPNDVIEEMLQIGHKTEAEIHPVPDEVRFLNEALAEEIERRKAMQP